MSFFGFLFGCFVLSLRLVPVWDGVNSDVKFAEDWNRVVELPPFKGEIPMGSFVVIAHALSGTTADPYLNLNFNILWAVVIAIPGPKVKPKGAMPVAIKAGAEGQISAQDSDHTNSEDSQREDVRNKTASGSGA